VQDKPVDPKFRVGDWVVDPTLDEVRRDARAVRLEPRVMRLLVHLASRPGELVTADELLDTVWRDVVVTPGSVYTSIARLRRVLEDGAEEPYVVTLPRRGYRLVAPVIRPAATTPRSALPEASPNVATGVAPGSEPTATPPIPPGPVPTPRRRPTLALVALAFAALAVGGALAWQHTRSSAPRAAVPVVAVLPFTATSEEPAVQALADSLGDELRAALARVPSVRVIGATSTAALRDREPSVLAREQGVTHVLAGTVASDVERTRIALQLVEADDGGVAWSHEDDPARVDLPGLTTALAAAVAGALGRASAPSDQPRDTRDPAAYDAYLQARREHQRWTPESFARAAYHYGRALAADPNFTLAQVGVAETAIGRQTVTSVSIVEAAAVAEPAIDRALEAAPSSADAFAARGLLRTNQFRLDEAVADLRRAIALNPNLVEAHVRLATALEYAGRPREALDVLDEARGRDPLNYMLHVRRCLALQNLGRVPDARQACATALGIDAVRPNARWAAALAELADGRLDRTIDGYRQTIEASPSRAQLHDELGWLYLDAGRPDLASASFATARLLAPGVAPTGAALVALVGGDVPTVRAELDAIVGAASSTQDALLDGALLAYAVDDTARAQSLLDRAQALTSWNPWYTRSIWSVRWGRSQELTLALAARARGDAGQAGERLQSLGEYLDELEAGGQRWAGIRYLRAGIHALEGQRDRAFAELDAAADRGWHRDWWAQRDPALAALRDDPRFAAWLRRVHWRGDAGDGSASEGRPAATTVRR
jgi:DNA-binding winged helix-turn-helix (wHTH) protein/TolB-like protein/Tfp pilus assembly protein PilF